MSLNIEQMYQCVRNFDFTSLFVKELRWSPPINTQLTAIDTRHTRLEIARLSGVPVFEIHTASGKIPDAHIRDALYRELLPLFPKSLLIFLDKERTQSLWYWIKREDSASYKREYVYAKGQPEDLFLNKLDSIVSDLLVFQDKKGQRERAGLRPVSDHIVEAFDAQRLSFTQQINGIEDEQDRILYAMILLSRLIFLYFLQRRGFLDGCKTYLESHLEASSDKSYYRQFLIPLFDGLATSILTRRTDLQEHLGFIPYLNGGMFLPHSLELDYPAIQIPNSAFEQLFSFFSQYNWRIIDVPIQKGSEITTDILRDAGFERHPLGAIQKENEITPDILGDIFEMYFNRQSQNGFYATPPEITEYLCRQTIHQFILDRVNQQSHRFKQGHFASIKALLEDLDAALCSHLLLDVLPSLSVLDPACGSGTFLVAALNTLVLIYSELANKVEDFHDDQLTRWLSTLHAHHPNRMYGLKKRIVTNNLFGVDIVEEAIEITRLRLCLALISSLENIEDLEPLPIIDFNLFPGDSLIGLLRLDDAQPTQSSLFPFDDHNMLRERDKLITVYRESYEYGEDLRLLRENIARKRVEATTYLNELLLDQFRQLQEEYGRRISPVIRIRSGEPINSTPTLADIERLRPFHWCYDFDQVMNQRGGFDVIMTNPPWEVLRSETSSSNFYRSLFCQFAPQYAHQNPMEQNRIQRQSLNLYKPFVEQCYNLLCDGGYCAMVIPTGICTDQNAAGLRQLLFTQTRVMGVFCFENRWEILRGLDPRFEFTLLSLKKGQRTTTFPAALSRQVVEDVEHFPEQNAVHISMNFLRRFSPGTLSLGKFRNQEDVSISEKMLRLPLLGEARHDAWNLKLGSGISSSPISRIEPTEPGPDVLPLYEGKTIHQFTHMFAPLRHWVHRESLAQEEQRTFSNTARIVKQWQTSGDHGYHLVFRSVASSTNNRTMIATILPPEALANNTLNFVATRLDEDALLFLAAMFNSFVVDFALRLRISTHVSIYTVLQLPIPHLTQQDKSFSSLVKRSAQLICTTEDFKGLWEGAMHSPWSPEAAATSLVERERLRAEIDGLVAHLYNVTEDEFTYILNTFPLVAAPTKVAAQNAYRDVKRGLIS